MNQKGAVMDKLILTKKDLEFIEKVPGKDLSEKFHNILEYYKCMNSLLNQK
jgi:hypothetical protein